MGISILIFSVVTFRMAAWLPSSIFQFPDSKFSLALNIKSKPHRHITCVYEKEPVDLQQCHFENGRLAAILDFLVSGLYKWHGFPQCNLSMLWNFNFTFHVHVFMVMGRLQKSKDFSEMSLSNLLPGSHIGFFGFWTFNFCLALNIKFKLQ